MSRKAVPAEAFEHGDPKRYRRGCRCRLCVRATTAEVRMRHYLRSTGRGTLRTTDRAAAHIDRLRAAGMQDIHISEAAKTASSVIYRIARGQARIHYAVEARILAVRVPQEPVGRNGSHVDACGTRRRLRALAAEGWPAAELARRLGRKKQYVIYLQAGRGDGTVRRWVADDVHGLYGRLSGLKPEREGVRPSLARAGRDRAASKGWLGVGYWDIDEIDDPAFVPATGGEERSRNELAAHRREEITHLAAYSIPEHEIAERLGMAPAYVHDLIRDMRSAA